MKITLDEIYNAKANFTTLGYVGETNARTITIEGYQCDGADSYKMRLKYPDNAVYDVDISGGTYTIEGSILRRVGDVYVQIFAYKQNGDQYDYVKKSNILRLQIGRSLKGDATPVPTYEKSVEALEKVLAISRKVDGMSDEINKAIAAANTAKDDLRTAVNSANDVIADVNSAADKANVAAENAAAAKSEIESATESANTAKSNLSAAQKTAETALSNLNSVIAQADTSDSDLKSTITAAETARDQLSDVITAANNANDTLSDTVLTATNLYTSLSAENEMAAENIDKLAKENTKAGELHMKADGIVCSAEGSAITLNDSADLGFSGLKIFGRSTQTTTTGAQLFDIVDIPKTLGGLTARKNSDGSITLTGTPTISSGNIFTYFLGEYIDLLEDGKTYKTSLRFQVQENGVNQYVTKITVNKATMTSIKPYIQIPVDKYTDGMTIYPMLNEGETVMPYEPYTGGIPSPNPDYPQDIVSVGGSGKIDVTIADGSGNSQSLTVSTPNGLPGIPVDSGGNYTDENGQQWICDEIDFQRGVYVQKILTETLTSFSKVSYETENMYNYQARLSKKVYGGSKYPVLNDKLIYKYSRGDTLHFYVDNNTNVINVFLPKDMDVTTFEMKILAILYEPYETPLTPEQISAYKSLHTNKPTTTITNSDSAHMEASYTADTKTYIDNKFAELQAAIISTGGNV